jgi:hypothetical protein
VPRNLEKLSNKGYLESIRERSGKGHVYRSYQMIGLSLAEILHDRPHKALYIRLAKNYNGQELMILAENIAEKRGVRNKGAYFMRLVQSLPKWTKKPPGPKKPKRKPRPKKKKQRTLF